MFFQRDFVGVGEVGGCRGCIYEPAGWVRCIEVCIYVQAYTLRTYIERNDASVGYLLLFVIKIYIGGAYLYIYNKSADIILCTVPLFAAIQSRINPLRTGADEKSGFNKTQLRIESAIYDQSRMAGRRE